MTINIRDEESIRLIIELSEKTGLSHDDAITVAVREKLEQMNASADFEEEIMTMARETNSRLHPIPDHATLLYDEKGLPV